MASRWADTEADKAEDLRRKKEKEERKRLKLLKQQEAEAAAQQADSRPSKRRRLSIDEDNSINQENQQPNAPEPSRQLLRFDAGTWTPSRHTSNYTTLNAIEEGSYGYVSRARNLTTSSIVALKKVKMENTSTDGFPITALREITILQKMRHPNIVSLLEVLGSDDPSECVLVMEFVEHDLKCLMEDMSEPFLASETKTLLRQLVSAVSYLHDNAIMHRDLKTSNILLTNRGQLKLADFGMARHIPPSDAPLTQLVVTLWYRAPELLLGAKRYGTEVDMWSVGCVFGELLSREPLLPGKNEVDELALIFSLCGVPNEQTWPSFYRLPNAKSLKLPRQSTTTSTSSFNRAKFPFLTAAGIDLLSSLLSLNPEHRPTAKEVLEYEYFSEAPKPKPSEMFPTFPSKAGREKRRRKSPHAPRRGDAPAVQSVDFSGVFAEREERGAGFQLKMRG